MVAILVTRGIERFGGLLGGVMGTIPSTIVPASIGFAVSARGPEALAAALAVTPVGMLLNAAFLWLWRVLPGRLPASSLGRRLALMTAISLSFWGAGAALVAEALSLARARGLPLVGLGWACTALIGLAGVLACLRLPEAPRGSRSVGVGTALARGILAALAVGCAMALNRYGGPVAAGMASVFPAIFLTTMVSLWLAQGEAVPAGAVGPMMLGASGVSVYAMLAARWMPGMGPWIGSFSAWMVAVLGVNVPAALWLRRRVR